MDFASSPSSQRRLTQLARQRFVDGLCVGLPDLAQKIQDYLSDLMGQTATQREMQQRRDAWMSFQAHHKNWVDLTGRAWRQALVGTASSRPGVLDAVVDSFELIDDSVMENKIIASRMAEAVHEKVGSAFALVRGSTEQIEAQDLAPNDVLQVQTLCNTLIEQWLESGLARENLKLLSDLLHRELVALILPLYQNLTRFYEEQGVVYTEKTLRSRVRRAESTDLGGLGSSGAGAPPRGMPESGQMALPTPPTGAGRRWPGALANMLAAGNPIHYARQRAQGVFDQVRRLLNQSVIDFDLESTQPVSAALSHALAEQSLMADAYYNSVSATPNEDAYRPMAVVQATAQVRERAAELKEKAQNPNEKAIIELVALMFQSILNEDRIAPAVRVWIARLQVPVLRVALGEEEFLNTLDHPARLLIDRIGTCVLGFEASAINGSALEAEIRRLVQVVEQYPETGKRVFQLVYDEFEKFLATYLTETQMTQTIMGVAQQVEQKETLVIQYTIELRDMLRNVPVRDEVREFLFRVWSEVLALSTVRQGAAHEETQAYKKAAADLIWAAGAKPTREERTKVIKSLPALLSRLRQGMNLVGITGAAQETHLKPLTDALTEAFASRTEQIPQEVIDAVAKRLSGLEKYISEDAASSDFTLDTETIEMLLGVDASFLTIVADNDTAVGDDWVDWARNMPVGGWYMFDHNGSTARVQYVWTSDRKQLHLFVGSAGECFLVQLHRLGAYLQAGLLMPLEEETLMLRATRDALIKLDANPERLLS